MAKFKLTLEDIFNDDEFGLLEASQKQSNVKSSEDRLIDSFLEIVNFVSKESREPNTSSMSEYNLTARLRAIRENEAHKKILKPYDKHNLLGHVEVETSTIDDILADSSGLLSLDDDLEIFDTSKLPSPKDRSETDFVARRQKMSNKEFSKYEAIFHAVHQDLKVGRRKLKDFKDVEQNLKEGKFYVLNGVILYLESVDFKRDNLELNESTLKRKDGRTVIIFENGTFSNMYYRSLSKVLYTDGRMITDSIAEEEKDLFVSANLVKEEDILSGWVYILKSKSPNPQIQSIKNLYKIGFTSTPLELRIKNAKNEATYLFADVTVVENFKIYNRNANKLESLLHRFFAEMCLDIDLYDTNNKRYNPREWFVVPLPIIIESIQLIKSGSIVNYRYNPNNMKIELKKSSKEN